MDKFLSNRLLCFLGLNFLWVILLGGFMHVTGNTPVTDKGLSIIGFLYMPAPAVFTLIFERFKWHEIADKYGLSFKRWQLCKIILWSVVFYSLFTALYLSLTFILGNWLGVVNVGQVIVSTDEFKRTHNISSLPLVNNVYLLYFISFLNSIFVGITLNALLAFGEELAWRGYVWRNIKHLGCFKGNLCLGVIWGLWHAPLILQGYSFPRQPIAGVGYMLMTTIALTFVFTTVTDRLKTVVVAAVIHGMMNATAYLSAVINNGSPPIGTILGLISAISILCAWQLTNLILTRKKTN
jgi:uncharacterized protein